MPPSHTQTIHANPFIPEHKLPRNHSVSLQAWFYSHQCTHIHTLVCFQNFKRHCIASLTFTWQPCNPTLFPTSSYRSSYGGLAPRHLCHHKMSNRGIDMHAHTHCISHCISESVWVVVPPKASGDSESRRQGV